MEETVVSFNYQDYGLLIRYTCSNFFQFHIYEQFHEFIQSGRTTTTWWAALFSFGFALRENWNKNGCVWHYGGSLCLCFCNENNLDLNEWQFTWTNLQVSADWPTTLFDDMQVILFLLGIREQDSISLSTNNHFHGLWGKGSLGPSYLYSCALQILFLLPDVNSTYVWNSGKKLLGKRIMTVY